MDPIYVGFDQPSSSHRLIIFYSRGALVKPVFEMPWISYITPIIIEARGPIILDDASRLALLGFEISISGRSFPLQLLFLTFRCLFDLQRHVRSSS